MNFSTRLEIETVDKMIKMYCVKMHGTENHRLCSVCSSLRTYAQHRIEKCVYGNDKPVCSKCSIHCYKPEMREAIKRVMQYSGPRMLWKSPILSLRHMYRQIFKSGVKKQRRL